MASFGDVETPENIPLPQGESLFGTNVNKFRLLSVSYCFSGKNFEYVLSNF